MHLIHALQEKYEITQYWTGSIYSGITLKWDYNVGILGISMPGYVQKAIHKFQHPTPSQPWHSPHQCNPPNYSSIAPQWSHQDPESPNLFPLEANTVQQVVGTFLYYAHAVDPTILVALNRIAAQQANSTEETAKVVTQLLNYAAMHSEAFTKYHHKIPCKRYDPPHPQRHIIYIRAWIKE